MPSTSDILDRFHQVLLQEISESRPEYLTEPFTVAEIYQNLVPYRSHRDLIGVEMNGDYEDVLLRLLAGEGDYLILDSEVARREIREELESPNPNTGLFRDFAAADVRLNPARISSGTEAVGGRSNAVPEAGDVTLPTGRGVEEPEAIDITDLRPDGDADVDRLEAAEVGGPADDGVIGHIEMAEGGFLMAVPDPRQEAEGLGYGSPGMSEGAGDAPSRFADESDVPGGRTEEQPERWSASLAAPETDEAPAPGDQAASSSACHWCRQNLPMRQVLNFCPFCGSDLRLFPCPKCGEEIEPGWQFCVSCGTEVGE